MLLSNIILYSNKKKSIVFNVLYGDLLLLRSIILHRYGRQQPQQRSPRHVQTSVGPIPISTSRDELTINDRKILAALEHFQSPNRPKAMASQLRRLVPARVANTGSQQRDHHANERTFLSWTRAGLGFAAMALALDRLDAFDRLLHSKLGLDEIERSQQKQNGGAVYNGGHAAAAAAPGTAQTRVSMFSNGFSASRLCQVLGVWSLGYGFFRYWSMRRYLMQGQFVPAFWGPVFMTCGSFGAFLVLGMQRRHTS